MKSTAYEKPLTGQTVKIGNTIHCGLEVRAILCAGNATTGITSIRGKKEVPVVHLFDKLWKATV